MYLHPILAGISADERAALVPRIEMRSFKRNETVLQAGDWSGHVYCVAEGLLRVVLQGSSESADATTDFVRRDDFFLSPSLEEDRYQADATLIAALPSSVYFIPLPEVRALCAQHPKVAMGLLEFSLQRLTLFRRQLRRVSAMSSERLVSRTLYELTQLAPTADGGYDKRITQSVIASYSGLSREQVNKIIRDLEQRGLVKKEEHGVQVSSHFASSDYQPLESLPAGTDLKARQQPGGSGQGD